MLENCFNYVGSKDRIFPAIDKNLDKSKSYLIDLFCGSGVVGLNEVNNYKHIMLNDACWQMTELLKYLRDNEFQEIIKQIDKYIKEYKLSKENKEGYLRLREDFNKEPYLQLVFDPAMFYCLITHSFNYNIHINSSGKFSVPSGYNRCYFNKNLRAKLEGFQWELHDNKDKIVIKNEKFEILVNKGERIIPNAVFYCDPPYYSSDDAYSRIHYLGKWDEAQERKLYKTLDFINDHGGSFLLSNVRENNGKINHILIDWCKKYNTIDVSTDFENCNYQRKNNGRTREILVRNY